MENDFSLETEQVTTAHFVVTTAELAVRKFLSWPQNIQSHRSVALDKLLDFRVQNHHLR